MKVIVIIVMALMLTACGSTTTTTEVTQVTQGDNGTYINNADGTVTYIQHISDGDATDGTTGEFDAGDDAQECRSKGFFYCKLENKCMNTEASSGSCTR